MCDSCGKQIKDVAIRAASYGAVRMLESFKPIEKVVEQVESGIGVAVEQKHNTSTILVKSGLNAAVDYVYGEYVYPTYKMGKGDMLGLCECEYMTAFWQVLAQALYEKMIMGGIKTGAIIKDIIAIYAQFPISRIVKKNSRVIAI